MQDSADITGREFDVAASGQAVAAGSAAGGFDTIAEAAVAIVRPHARTFRPDARAQSVYDDLFADYMLLHDHFGKGGDDVMPRLRALRDRQVRAAPALA